MGLNTQQDPIGIAGGLNLYGYANGDPVNFSDPFGLCPPLDVNLVDCPTATEDERTLLAMYWTLVNGGFSDVISDLVGADVPEVKITGDMPLGALGQVERANGTDVSAVAIRPSLSVPVMAASLAHEVHHAGTGPGNSIYEERGAWRRGLSVYTGLGGQGGNAGMDRWLAALILGPKAFDERMRLLYPGLQWTRR